MHLSPALVLASKLSTVSASCLAVQVMTDSDETKQDLLRNAWLDAKSGGLPGREQAKAWALRELWKHSGKGEHGMKTFICTKLKKKGGGSPTVPSLCTLFDKIDADPDWFPGKANYDNCGAPCTMTSQNRAAIARCAMAMKADGVEPTYGKVVAACPKAALNPKTKQFFCKDTIYGIMQEDCYDDDPMLPWVHKARYSKKALTTDMMERREKFADYLLGLDHAVLWYYYRVVWVDLCSSILPKSEKKANEMALARKGGKGWISPGSELASENTKADKANLKQKSWDTVRIWWFPLLSRGKLHVEIFDAGFPGETPAGARTLIEKVRSVVNVRFQAAASKPEIIFTDRGRGFFWPNSGGITPDYKEALDENGFTAFMGCNAVKQPGSCQDMMLHETAVSWLRTRLATSTPTKCWEETREQYGNRLKRCCEEVNKDCDVEGLCKQFPKRIRLLKQKEGDRLKY